MARRLERLRSENTPGPWSREVVRGMLSNDLYRGISVWGRTRNQSRLLKKQDGSVELQEKTKGGRAVRQAAPMDDWTRTEVPALRIVSDELWSRVRRVARPRVRLRRRRTRGSRTPDSATVAYSQGSPAVLGAAGRWAWSRDGRTSSIVAATARVTRSRSRTGRVGRVSVINQQSGSPTWTRPSTPGSKSGRRNPAAPRGLGAPRYRGFTRRVDLRITSVPRAGGERPTSHRGNRQTAQRLSP